MMHRERDLEPQEAKALLASGAGVVLLDVREAHEYEIVHIPGSRLIPLADLQQRASELNPADSIIAYCHHGIRSQQAVWILKQLGFANVRNMRGGIEAWACEVDKEMARY